MQDTPYSGPEYNSFREWLMWTEERVEGALLKRKMQQREERPTTIV